MIQVFVNNFVFNIVIQGSRKCIVFDGLILVVKDGGDFIFGGLVRVVIGGMYDGQGINICVNWVVVQFSVIVFEVLVNGDIVVFGWQVFNVSGECINIWVSGWVWFEDIGLDNVVLFLCFVDVCIEYDGKGFVSCIVKFGIVLCLFNWLGLL